MGTAELYDFDTDEIIKHLGRNSLTNSQINKLRIIIDESEEDIADEMAENILGNNDLYQQIINIDTLSNKMKLEVILTNLDKFDYLKICNMFEKY